MSKTNIALIVVGSALLAITIFIVLRIPHSGGGDHHTAATSRQIATGTASNADDPMTNRKSFKTTNRDSAEELERQRLVAKNRNLEDKLRRTKQRSDFLGDLAGKLASSGDLQMPQTEAEAAVLAGQVHRTGSDFAAKWGGAEPSADSPEFQQYKDESDELTSDLAAVLKSIETFWGGDLADSSSSVAQFQSLQMYGALELDDANWEALDGLMSRHYEDGFSEGLNGANKPETGVDQWQARRAAASQQAFDEIQRTLPAEKRDDFQRLYERDHFLWNFSIGGL